MAGLMQKSSLFWVLLPLAVYQCILVAQGEIHTLKIKDDSRELIMLEVFGYTSTGRLEMEVKDVAWSPVAPSDNLQSVGFLLVTEDGWMQAAVELEQKKLDCVLQSHFVKTLFTFNDLNSVPAHDFNCTYPSPGANRYILLFANCLNGTVPVSMTVKTSMYNLEGNDTKDFLSEGLTQLPLLYFCFFWIHVALEGVWIYILVKQRMTVHRIHILMGVLVFLKALYVFSEAEDKFYIKKTGTPHGWDVAFYAFSFLKGVMLFTVIVLIGTGWSFLKPYLQGKEKKVLMIVIPLQVLANIATVIIEERGPSSRDWFTWTQLLLLVDVICFCAVLFPIVWSIKHLREAAHTDGKAARNLVKLTLFRQYYIVVVSYLYFTRIVVFPLQYVTSYHYEWVSDLARELATLAFYVFTGYKFRPVQHNPYIVLEDEEEEAMEEDALKDDDFDL